jgi:hypothetical protein
MKLKVKSLSSIEQWCEKHLGPRLYYIHDRRGGMVWRIKKDPAGGWELEIDNDHQALLLILKFSDEIST